MPQNRKNERSSLKNERYLRFIWSIPRMSDKCYSYQKELSSLNLPRPSNKPERLHAYFWATLYIMALYKIIINDYHIILYNVAIYGTGDPFFYPWHHFHKPNLLIIVHCSHRFSVQTDFRQTRRKPVLRPGIRADHVSRKEHLPQGDSVITLNAVDGYLQYTPQ